MIDNINWYPGHMAKTRRLIEENLKLVDIVAEIVDARIPKSSRNPDFDNLLKSKKRIVVLNKSDIADLQTTKKWQKYYTSQGICAICADSKQKKGVSDFLAKIKEVLCEEEERKNSRGMTGKPIRIMILGVPNVGKSTFINALAGAKVAKAQDKPGVTRGKQWVSIQGADLLDMPGILWPKIDDSQTGINLALTGAVRDQILDIEELACQLLSVLNTNYKEKLQERYKIATDITDGYELLKLVAKKRGFLISGGELDTERAAIIVIDEYRAGKLGAISLESPEDI
ncbi:MAG: ribosome biogenesis GTPase YlqF [Ruminococcaceae bacterium]|nr:ribosome biogenesis GTPase YlqF [Oscillospiraceae bacterium]